MNTMRDRPFDVSPPCDLEAEESVLGAVLLDPRVIDSVSDILQPTDFHSDANRRIYAQLLAMAASGGEIDPLLLADRLQQAGELEAVGGVSYLGAIMASVHMTLHVVRYAEIVRENSLRRRLILAASDLIVRAQTPGEPLKPLLDSLESILFSGDRCGDRPITDAVEWMCRTTGELDNVDSSPVIPTGIASLDVLLGGGFRPGQMPVIAARPSVGKSALMLNMAVHIAKVERVPVGIFSMEMLLEELGKRALSADSETRFSSIMRPAKLNQDDYERISESACEISESPIFIDDNSRRTVSDIELRARRLIRKHGVRILFVDYLGLIEHEDSRVGIYQRVTDISRRLKTLAQTLKIPIVVLCQLNRESVKPRMGVKLDRAKLDSLRPRLDHLRDSGAIEQDADIVLLLHRPETVVTREEAVELGIVNEAELIVAKNRQGRRGTVDLIFDGPHARFVEPELEIIKDFQEFMPHAGQDDNSEF